MDTCIPDIPTAAAPLTDVALCKWLGAAAPGDCITYHRGFLARDISPLTQMLPEPDRVALMRLAGRAWKLADADLAHLLQRRHGDEDYEYLIVARRRPRRADPRVLARLLKEAA
jgi:hypothetical protein